MMSPTGMLVTAGTAGATYWYYTTHAPAQGNPVAVTPLSNAAMAFAGAGVLGYLMGSETLFAVGLGGFLGTGSRML